MPESIVAAPTFQERMYERVKESLGELLTPEEARELVDRAIQQSLFQPQQKQQPTGWGGGSQTKTVENPFLELVKNEVKPLIEEAIERWIADHSKEVNQTIEKVLQEGILAACFNAISHKTKEPLLSLQNDLYRVVNKIGGI